MKKLIITLSTLFAMAYTVYPEEKTPVQVNMVELSELNIKMSATEITQGVYEKVMGFNPSWYQFSNKELYEKDNRKLLKNLEDECGNDTSNCSVDNVSWYDAIYFCNKLSVLNELTPVYAINGETDVNKWNYAPNQNIEHDDFGFYNSRKSLNASLNAMGIKYVKGLGKIEISEIYEPKIEQITQNLKANGYRLPTNHEWTYALGLEGKNRNSEFQYAEVIGGKIVAQKEPNKYGLYDMTTCVSEWVWNPVLEGMRPNHQRTVRGDGLSLRNSKVYEAFEKRYHFPGDRDKRMGFRIVCKTN